MKDPREALEAHVRGFFAGHAVERRTWADAPVEPRTPGLYVLEIGPGPRFAGWSYVTVGSWESATQGTHGMEFVLSSDAPDVRNVELLFMTAHYGAGPTGHRLDWGHTVPIGKPWRGGRLDHVLISTPYAYGPDLEICAWAGGHARILALMPISVEERDYKAERGVEALEQEFEEQGIDFAKPTRRSII